MLLLLLMKILNNYTMTLRFPLAIAIFSILTGIVITSCSDGEFITEDINFDDSTVQLCNNYVFYELANQNKEALIIEIDTDEDILTNTDQVQEFTINNTSNRVVYRIFNNSVSGSNYFCNSIPPIEPTVIEEWTAPSGTIQIQNTLEEDDEDGISAEEEGFDVSNPELSTDTDGDGIPDYKDIDDDGDNVLTSTEAVKVGDVYRDTDGDGTPDYLDPDDDGDGVLTRNEDANGDLAPGNDVVLINGEEVPAYLTTESAIENVINQYRPHDYSFRYTNQISLIDGFKLENQNQEIKFDVDNYLYGTYGGSWEKVDEFTPTFNP
ncbi:hypothetical protein SAMN04487906_0528 [Zhouia amylolytica]|uniref:Thrombospondin type 3 repeat-containing protein n=2 Tax=Zhouia amylolytica TaxID=376730 RepID=A0A1I6Q9X3_9FLAO|nr:hypothetical protein SAMN04487906_0528 [Zhouia amylolytica]